jgi:hypothetical protein
MHLLSTTFPGSYPKSPTDLTGPAGGTTRCPDTCTLRPSLLRTHEWRGEAAQAHACVPSAQYLAIQRLDEGLAVLVALLVVEVLPDLFLGKTL